MLLQYYASLWSDMLYSLSLLLFSSLSVSKFSQLATLGCSMLHWMCSIFHCMLMFVGRINFCLGGNWLFITLKFLSGFGVIRKIEILHYFVVPKSFYQRFIWVAASSLKTLALHFNSCLIALEPNMVGNASSLNIFLNERPRRSF